MYHSIYVLQVSASVSYRRSPYSIEPLKAASMHYYPHISGSFKQLERFKYPSCISFAPLFSTNPRRCVCVCRCRLLHCAEVTNIDCSKAQRGYGCFQHANYLNSIASCIRRHQPAGAVGPCSSSLNSTLNLDS